MNCSAGLVSSWHQARRSLALLRILGLYPSLVGKGVMDAVRVTVSLPRLSLVLRSAYTSLRLTFQLETFVCPKLFQHSGPVASGDVSALGCHKNYGTKEEGTGQMAGMRGNCSEGYVGASGKT